MFEKKKLLTAALGLIGLGTTALDSHAGICFSVTPPPPWNNLYACGANGTIDTRDSCSPAFPGGQPICVPRLAVQKNGGLITKAEGINSAERGIGLGLAIARELIERQQGAIWLDHTSEQGSTFSFTLPVAENNSID